MANNNHKSKELFPETNAFFRGLFSTKKPEPPKTVRELRRAISASGLRHADCVERSELEKRYNDAVVAARRVDGAAPCSVPGPGLTAYWTADAENVPEGRQPALDVTRAFCQHLTGISRYY